MGIFSLLEGEYHLCSIHLVPISSFGYFHIPTHPTSNECPCQIFHSFIISRSRLSLSPRPSLSPRLSLSLSLTLFLSLSLSRIGCLFLVPLPRIHPSVLSLSVTYSPYFCLAHHFSFLNLFHQTIIARQVSTRRHTFSQRTTIPSQRS